MARANIGSLYVQVLGSGSWDLPAGLLLFCEAGGASAVLVNCGEGTQRFCTEHRLRIATRLRSLLLTRLTWEAIGGLPGMLFTLADIGRGDSVQLCGPVGVASFVRTFRHFMGATALPGVILEVVDAQAVNLKESGIAATPIVLGSAAFDPSCEDAAAAPSAAVAPCQGTASTGTESCKRQRVDDSSGTAAALGGDFEPVCVCWLLQMPALPPKFDAAAAQALGVPNGPLRGRLCAGETVDLPDGSSVTPDQVLRGGSHGEELLVIDCASLAQLAQLRAHPLIAGRASRQHARPLAAVVHLTPRSVAAQAEYAQLCSSFPECTLQLVLHHAPQPQRFAFVASARLQLKLGSLHSGIFPPPLALAQPRAPGAGAAAHPAAEAVPPGCVAADMLSRIVLRPLDKSGLSRDDEARLLRWSTSSGSSVSLDPVELHSEVAALAELPLSLSRLPAEMLQPPGSWQGEVRAALAAGGQPPAGGGGVNAVLGGDAAVGDATTGSGDASAAGEAADATAAGAVTEATAAATVRASRAELIFLGTGAAMPAKYRNVSSFLLQLPLQLSSSVTSATLAGAGVSGAASPADSSDGSEEDGASGGILFDCGEGTLASLRRRFGAWAPRVVRGLELVWISHIHADHHLGLLRLLEMRKAWGASREHDSDGSGPDAPCAPSRVPPLLVVGPHALGTWLREAAARLHSRVEFRFVHCGSASSDAAVGAAVRRLGGRWVASAPVLHCPDAWCVALQHEEGWGMVYSGDTRPCDALVALGRRLDPACRLLVHEATFDDTDEMAHEAVARRHSTVGEAIQVGHRMGAWRVLLTHFSQRYPKLPDVRQLPTAGAVLAFDLMSIPFCLLPGLPLLTPALLCLFADELATGGIENAEVEAPTLR
jgi:ribonuclease Z